MGGRFTRKVSSESRADQTGDAIEEHYRQLGIGEQAHFLQVGQGGRSKALAGAGGFDFTTGRGASAL